MRRPMIALLVMSLLLGACTSSGSEDAPVTTSAPAVPDDTADPGSVGGSSSTSDPGAGSEDSEVPPIPILTPAESIVEPGDTVAISADPRLSGTVVMSDSAGDAAAAILRAGKAILTVPTDLAEGAYQLRLEGEPSVFGVVGVSNGPGMWLGAPEYVLADEDPEVLVTTHGLPSGMVAALEVTTGNGAAERLVPHPMLGLAPITASTATGLPDGPTRWVLPTGFSGSVRVVAGRAADLDPIFGSEADPPFMSAEHRIRACDEVGVIAGDLGASGVVRAIWMAAELESSSVVAEAGTFSLDVRPGTVLVTAHRDDGETAASPMLVQVKCGETIDVGAGDTPVDTGPAPGSFLGGLTIDDLFVFSAQSTGEITIGSTGFAECSMTGGALGVSLDPESSTEPYYYTLTIEEFDGTGRFDGIFSVIDIFTDEFSEGPVTVEAELATIDGIDAVGGALTGDLTGALGGGSVDVTFSCALFGGLEVMARRSGAAEPRAVNTFWPKWLGGKQTKPCRVGLAVTNTVGSEPDVVKTAQSIMAGLIARLEDGVKLLRWSSQGDVNQLVATEAQQQLLGVEADMAIISALRASLDVDFLLVVGVWRSSTGLWGSDVRVLTTDGGRLKTIAVTADTGADSEAAFIRKVLRQWRQLKRALKAAAICGEADSDSVSPGKGGQEKVSYDVTDLEGEPVDATIDKLASSCGSFSPDSGRTADHRIAPGDPSPAAEAFYRQSRDVAARQSTGGGTFTTTLTGEVAGCTDEVTFVARAQGPSGEITTERDKEESTVAITIPMFEFKVTIDIAAGADALHSESTGQFFVEPDFNQIIGAGGGFTHWEVPNFPCLVISESGLDERTQLFTGDGTYQVMPVGELASGDLNSSGTVNFIPQGYLSNITVSYSDPDCFPPGTSTNDPFGTAIFGISTFYPHILAGKALQGFEVPFKTDGSQTSRTWQFIESPGSVTIEVWAAQTGADSN